MREETRRASNEIRHTVSELGRRLALDLPQFLDRHRQLIVGELRGAGPATTGPGASPATAPVLPGEGPAGTTDAHGADPGADDGLSSDETAPRRKRRRRKEG